MWHMIRQGQTLANEVEHEGQPTHMHRHFQAHDINWLTLMDLRRRNKLKNWSSLIHNRLRNWQWHDALRCLNYKYTIGWSGGTFLIRPDLEFLNFVNTIFIQTKPKFSRVLTPYIWLVSNYKEFSGLFWEQVVGLVVQTVSLNRW